MLLLKLEKLEEARISLDKSLLIEPENPLNLINSCQCNLIFSLKTKDLKFIEEFAIKEAF
jgi:hypothetical protein